MQTVSVAVVLAVLVNSLYTNCFYVCCSWDTDTFSIYKLFLPLF